MHRSQGVGSTEGSVNRSPWYDRANGCKVHEVQDPAAAQPNVPACRCDYEGAISTVSMGILVYMSGPRWDRLSSPPISPPSPPGSPLTPARRRGG
eukprot:1189825-Prorocentrum_minimum.AAC.1